VEQITSGESDNIRKPFRRQPKITVTQTTSPPPQANSDNRTKNVRTVPPRVATGRNPPWSRREGPGRGCARGPPASSNKGWSRPWSGRGGNGTVRIPTTLTGSGLGQGPRGHRGAKPSPLPGMRGNEIPRFWEGPAPGTGPLGDDLCDESPTGQGREVRGLP
jgi:hypothetical protein